MGKREINNFNLVMDDIFCPEASEWDCNEIFECTERVAQGSSCVRACAFIVEVMSHVRGWSERGGLGGWGEEREREREREIIKRERERLLIDRYSATWRLRRREQMRRVCV
jgi:hypothetical protein